MVSSDQNHSEGNEDAVAMAAPDAAEKAKQKKKSVLPILKTYVDDYRSLAEAVDDVELRKMLAREMEKKKIAQAEYRRKVAELFKTEMMLREQEGELSKKDVEKLQEKAEMKVTEDSVREAVEGATDIMYDNLPDQLGAGVGGMASEGHIPDFVVDGSIDTSTHMGTINKMDLGSRVPKSSPEDLGTIVSQEKTQKKTGAFRSISAADMGIIGKDEGGAEVARGVGEIVSSEKVSPSFWSRFGFGRKKNPAPAEGAEVLGMRHIGGVDDMAAQEPMENTEKQEKPITEETDERTRQALQDALRVPSDVNKASLDGGGMDMEGPGSANLEGASVGGAGEIISSEKVSPSFWSRFGFGRKKNPAPAEDIASPETSMQQTEGAEVLGMRHIGGVDEAGMQPPAESPEKQEEGRRTQEALKDALRVPSDVNRASLGGGMGDVSGGSAGGTKIGILGVKGVGAIVSTEEVSPSLWSRFKSAFRRKGSATPDFTAPEELQPGGADESLSIDDVRTIDKANIPQINADAGKMEEVSPEQKKETANPIAAVPDVPNQLNKASLGGSMGLGGVVGGMGLGDIAGEQTEGANIGGTGSAGEGDSVQEASPSLWSRFKNMFRKKTSSSETEMFPGAPEELQPGGADESLSIDDVRTIDKANIPQINADAGKMNKASLGGGMKISMGADLGAAIISSEPMAPPVAGVAPKPEPVPVPDLTTEPVAVPEKRSAEPLNILENLHRPQRNFSEEEQMQMRAQQERIVKGEQMKSALQDFELRKEKLKEMGIAARDLRSYTLKKTPNVTINKQNVAFTLLIVSLVVGLVIILGTIALKPRDVLLVSPPPDLGNVSEAITKESEVFVDVSTSFDEWRDKVREGGDLATITEFIPYEIVDTENRTVSLESFARLANMRLPAGLLRGFTGEYFAGTYNTTTREQGIFIVSVRDYGNTLVWMLNWEQDAINAFLHVFPGIFQSSLREDVAVRPASIDNKTVRILNNGRDASSLLYYFFDRETLVFVAGDETLIPEINNRIRRAR